MFAHCFYKGCLRCSLVASLCTIAFQNLTFMINSTPQVKAFSIYFQKEFIQMPLLVRMLADPLLSDFSREL